MHQTDGRVSALKGRFTRLLNKMRTAEDLDATTSTAALAFIELVAAGWQPEPGEMNVLIEDASGIVQLINRDNCVDPVFVVKSQIMWRRSFAKARESSDLVQEWASHNASRTVRLRPRPRR